MKTSSTGRIKLLTSRMDAQNMPSWEICQTGYASHLKGQDYGTIENEYPFPPHWPHTGSVSGCKDVFEGRFLL